MKLETYLKTTKTRATGLARKAGVPASSLTRFMRGDRKTLAPSTAAKVSTATDGAVSVAELLFPSGLPAGACMSGGVDMKNTTTMKE